MTLITYPAPACTDDTGAVVTPASVSVGITDADGNAITNAAATGHFAGPNLSAQYDADLYGEAWLTLTPVLPGHTFVNYSKVGLYASDDSSRIVGVVQGAVGGLLESVVGGTITVKQALALNLCYNFGQYTRVKTATTQTLTFQDREGVTFATSITSLDTSGNPTGRTSVAFSNLPN